MTGDRRDIATACVLCSHNCGLRVDVEAGQIVNVRPDRENPITRGYICNKGFSINKYVHHAERVRQPLRRSAAGTLEPITWDQAIREIADKLRELRARHPSRCIGLVGAGGQGNHMSLAYAVNFLHGLGSPMWFNSLAQEKTQHSLLDQWMFRTSPATWLYSDDDHTRYLLVLGSNPRISHRGHNATDTLKAIASDPDRTLVVVDPRQTETARQADLHVALRPGTDCYFLLGMLAALLGEDRIDRGFVAHRTRGIAALRAAIAGVELADMAARCGVPAALIARVAEGFAASAPASIVCDLGVEQTRFSTLNAYLIRAILAVTGNLGRAGSNLFYEVLNPPDPLIVEPRSSAAALVSGIRGIRAMSDFEMFSPSLVPEEILADHPARLRALIVDGANPLVSYADTSRWRTALRELELLVVIDPALTETAQLAHYVLPTPVGYEKWEISMFPKHARAIHAQVRPPALARDPEALPEPEIYARLTRALGLFRPVPRALHALARRGRQAPLRVASALAAAVDRRPAQGQLLFWLYDTLGAQLPDRSLTVIWLLCLRNALLRRRGVLRVLGPAWRWRDPIAIGNALFARLLAHPGGTEIAELDLATNFEDHVRFRDRRVRLAPPAMLDEVRRALAAPAAGDREFPLILSAGLRTPWTANTLHRDPSWRKGKGPHCAVSVSVDDAAALGVAAGDTVVVRTRRGAAELPLAIDPRLSRGHVWVPNGFGARYAGQLDGANLNELTCAEDRDPFTGCPHHKWVPCRIERPARPPGGHAP